MITPETMDKQKQIYETGVQAAHGLRGDEQSGYQKSEGSVIDSILENPRNPVKAIALFVSNFAEQIIQAGEQDINAVAMAMVGITKEIIQSLIEKGLEIDEQSQQQALKDALTYLMQNAPQAFGNPSKQDIEQAMSEQGMQQPIGGNNGLI